MDVTILDVDYSNPQQTEDLVILLDDYAQGAMGGGLPLSENVKRNLALSLAQVPGAFSILAYVGREPAALLNAFQGFSTFKCQPLINIHDLAVKFEYRGLGLSQRLLTRAEAIATQRGCCKMTLEVLSGNGIAKNAYLKYGFSGYVLDSETGHALFWQKSLKSDPSF